MRTKKTFIFVIFLVLGISMVFAEEAIGPSDPDMAVSGTMLINETVNHTDEHIMMGSSATGQEEKTGTQEASTQEASTQEASCDPDISVLEVADLNISDVPVVSRIVGNNKIILARIDEKEFYYYVKDGIINPAPESDADYIVETDSCTFERVLSGSDPWKEYADGNIRFSAGTFTSRVKVMIANTFLKVRSWLFS